MALPVVVVQKVVKLNLNGEKLMEERKVSVLVSSRSTFNLKLKTQSTELRYPNKPPESEQSP